MSMWEIIVWIVVAVVCVPWVIEGFKQDAEVRRFRRAVDRWERSEAEFLSAVSEANERSATAADLSKRGG